MTRFAVLALFIGACGGGVSSDPSTGDAAVQIDAAVDGATGTDVTDHEPNDERVEATQFPAGDGSFTVHGTCATSADLDYYDVHPSAFGGYSVRLQWQAGAYELAFDPEDGMSPGTLVKSTVSPLTTSGTVTMSPAQFGIDCYNDNNPPGVAGLAYTLYITLP